MRNDLPVTGLVILGLAAKLLLADSALFCADGLPDRAGQQRGDLLPLLGPPHPRPRCGPGRHGQSGEFPGGRTRLLLPGKTLPSVRMHRTRHTGTKIILRKW